MPDITFEEANRVLRYEPSTGRLFWRPRPESDFGNKLSFYAWERNRAGTEALTTLADGYRVGTVLRRFTRAHRLIWLLVHGEWPKGEVDHINGDRSDNRIINLRVVTRAENQRNRVRGSNNTSGEIGVVYDSRHGTWDARIKVNGKSRYLGTYRNKDDAIAVRRAANRQMAYTPREPVAASR